MTESEEGFRERNWGRAEEQWQKTQVCPSKGFTSWLEATMPIHVLLIRDFYADGHHEDWGLMTTEDLIDPFPPLQDYALRISIEERHRLLKCFYDLTDFRSRTFNAITAPRTKLALRRR